MVVQSLVQQLQFVAPREPIIGHTGAPGLPGGDVPLVLLPGERTLEAFRALSTVIHARSARSRRKISL